MSYARVHLANYYVDCENQTYKLHEGINNICNNYIELDHGRISILTQKDMDFREHINKIILEDLKNGSR